MNSPHSSETTYHRTLSKNHFRFQVNIFSKSSPNYSRYMRYVSSWLRHAAEDATHSRHDAKTDEKEEGGGGSRILILPLVVDKFRNEMLDCVASGGSGSTDMWDLSCCSPRILV